MSDDIGALRVRIVLERPVRSADDIGGAGITWAPEAELWAGVRATAAGERAPYDGLQSVSSLTITIYRRGDVRVGWRVRWGARVLRVAGVRDDGAARIELACEEEIS